MASKFDPNMIKNKQKRALVKARIKSEDKRTKKKARVARQQEHAELGDKAPPKQVPRTLDNTREKDETVIEVDDEEVQGDEAIDEFAEYFSGDIQPKIAITSCYNPRPVVYDFIKLLLHIFPHSHFYKRKKVPIKNIVKECTDAGFTDVVIINEDRKNFNGWTQIHLPEGPTAHFKLSSVVFPEDIKGHGTMSSHKPEVILNNFTTRLGHRVGRMLGSLFHQEPNFTGRRVCTFHNQRDYIFFRQHRYIFDTESQSHTRLQELGPRFTLKLRWLQHGTFDTKHGEFEWMSKKEMITSRKRFFL